MLSKKSGYLLIALAVLSSILTVITIQFYEFDPIDIMMIVLVLAIVHFVVMIVFIVDAYRNGSVQNRWIWIVLMIIAPIVVMIAYTLTYVPDSISDKV